MRCFATAAVVFLLSTGSALADRMIWSQHAAEIIDGDADHASLNQPLAMTGDGHGGLYIADIGRPVIRHYDAATRRIETIAGDGERGFSGDGGPGRDARFGAPISMARDARGILYISDITNDR